MKKIKPIMPSMREKKRYLAIEIISDSKTLQKNSISWTIVRGIDKYIGVMGSANAGVMFLPEKYNPSKNRGIIKVNHNYLNSLRAGLTLIDKIDDHEVIVRSLGASGMINKAYEKYVQ